MELQSFRRLCFLITYEFISAGSHRELKLRATTEAVIETLSNRLIWLSRSIGFCGNACGVTHFSLNLSLSPPIISSKSPGSTTGLLSAPMKDKSSRRNLKLNLRLWPGCK
jgi:hypothetical protein